MPSPHAPVFEADLIRLRWQLTQKPGGVGPSYFQALRKKLAELGNGVEGKRWYLPHSILESLLDGSPAAIAVAKTEFLKEWSHGDTLDRRIHYWNSLQFKTGDRWICAAMLSQLLILWDWLAAAEAWSEAEIDAAATEALDVTEAYLEPHLKGRGHMPFLPDPINQTAACITGLLYVGYMFGKKWRSEARAQRMYAFARNLLPDAIGQFPANGYDHDGFTYIRHIHLQVHTLSVALLEEVEGGDWYHRRFAPHNLSLNDLNEMQLDLITPSGFAWPLGRYGYIRSWNLFCQSFAARRTGDPRYLQLAKRDNEKYRFDSPWLGMDLPLGLLWYPGDLDEAITSGTISIPQKRRVLEDSWAVFTNDADRMLAVATWMHGKAPHFFLEAHGSPLILGGFESWTNSNCVQCDPEKWSYKSWLNPPGKLLLYCDVPGLQAAWFDSAATYPPAVGVTRASRVFLNSDAGLIISDRFESASSLPTVWQAATWIDPKLDGRLATIAGVEGVKLRAVTAEGEWTYKSTPERKPRYEGRSDIELGLLQLAGQNGKGAFDVLLDWQQTDVSKSLRRVQDGELTVDSPKGSTTIALPGGDKFHSIGRYQTDAKLALLEPSGRLCVASVRTVREGSVERMWSSLPVDVTIQDDACWASGLKYGEFIALRSADYSVTIRIGNGIEIWGRSPTPLRIHLRHPAVAGQLNGEPIDLPIEDGWTVIDIPDTTAASKAAGESLAAAVASGETAKILRACHDIQQAMAWEFAADVRRLLTWDASREPVLPNHVLKTEATYVRLEAAATAMCLGDRNAIPDLIQLLLSEARRNYAPPEVGVPGAKWWGFPTRNVALEAIMILHGVEVLGVLDEVLSHEAWAHGIDAVARTRAVFA